VPRAPHEGLPWREWGLGRGGDLGEAGDTVHNCAPPGRMDVKMPRAGEHPPLPCRPGWVTDAHPRGSLGPEAQANWWTGGALPEALAAGRGVDRLPLCHTTSAACDRQMPCLQPSGPAHPCHCPLPGSQRTMRSGTQAPEGGMATGSNQSIPMPPCWTIKPRVFGPELLRDACWSLVHINLPTLVPRQAGSTRAGYPSHSSRLRGNSWVTRCRSLSVRVARVAVVRANPTGALPSKFLMGPALATALKPPLFVGRAREGLGTHAAQHDGALPHSQTGRDEVHEGRTSNDLAPLRALVPASTRAGSSSFSRDHYQGCAGHGFFCCAGVLLPTSSTIRSCCCYFTHLLPEMFGHPVYIRQHGRMVYPVHVSMDAHRDGVGLQMNG
jgi:hypothetical protein